MSVFFSMLAAGLRCDAPVEAAPGQPFTLKAGQTASIASEKVTVTFIAVSEDSRCPKGEQCITAGNARVLLEVAAGSAAPARVELNLGRGVSEAVVGTLEVILVGLEPYPVAGRSIQPEDYRVSLTVRRL